ncbi:hypothetical protein M9458_035121, partial [Cirrhinus mrigala]
PPTRSLVECQRPHRRRCWLPWTHAHGRTTPGPKLPSWPASRSSFAINSLLKTI